MKIANQVNTSQLMLNQFKKSNDMNAKKLQQLATGYRINNAGDDASGLAMAKKMDALRKGISVDSRNSQDAVSMLQTADGALSSVSDATQRMNELASRASNGTLGSEERQALQAEYDQLASEIDRIGQSTTFNGNKLFDGSNFTMKVGPGSGDTMDIEMSKLSASALGIGNMNLLSQDGASKAMDALKGATSSISTQRAKIGAAENGLQSVLNNLGNSEINLVSSMSKIMDTDMASGSTGLSMSKVMNQSSMAMLQNSQHMLQQDAVNLLAR